MSSCGLVVEVIYDLAICVNTPLGPCSMITKIVRFVDLVVENMHMPIDILVLPMSEFDVVLGMDQLNRCCVTIHCYNAILSFKLKDKKAKHELVRSRPPYMTTMELWEMEMVATLSVDGKELMVAMVLIV